MRKKYLTILAILVVSAGCKASENPTATSVAPSTAISSAATTSAISLSVATSSTISAQALLNEPILGGISRVTKKGFGLYVSPGHSPISPERFTGYHTGVDFETTTAEQTVDVPVFAACNGKLLLKKYASGYGGVAVQACVLAGQDVTIIYGHLRLSSISPNVGDPLTAGQQIAVLGTGYSQETDGERRHLHFGIHKGTTVNILGYVQSKEQLNGWLNPLDYLR